MTDKTPLFFLLAALAAAPAAWAQASDYTPRTGQAWHDSGLLESDIPVITRFGGIPDEAIENPEYGLDLNPDNPEGAASLPAQRAVLADTLELWRTARPEQQDEIRLTRREQWALLSSYEKHRVRTQWIVVWKSLPAYRKSELLHSIERPQLEADAARAQANVNSYRKNRENPPGPVLYGPKVGGPVLYKPRLLWNAPTRNGGLDPAQR